MSFNHTIYYSHTSASGGGEEGIHRGNCESWFLLYVDNELRADQKAAVEAFVADHADLNAELELLLSTRIENSLQLDANFRQSLLRTEVEEATLLLYIDDELPANERLQLEQQMVSDDKLTRDLRLLQRTVSTPDETLVFPDKSLLYKEATPAKIHFIHRSFVRYTAAAAVLLLMGNAFWLLWDKKEIPEHPSGAIQQQTEKQVPVKGYVTVTGTTVNAHNDKIDADTHSEASNTSNITAKVGSTSISNLTEQEKQPASVDESKGTSVEPESFVSAHQQPVEYTSEKKSITIGNITDASSVTQETKTMNAYASYTSYDFNQEAANDHEDESFRDDERIRRSGFKGIIRRIKRTVERTTPFKSSGSNNVSFGVFAVNTN